MLRDLYYGSLATLLLKSVHTVGTRWAWRIVKLVHAIPYFAAAYAFGWASCWFWGDVIPRNVGGALCAGGVMFGAALDWFKEWRRGY
jgi:hypothetical protein